ncbi:MAG TPA: type II secretion system protein [Gammaproteobacteria bacterium]
MKKVQTGFTLIELVVVIVILGILAVTAVPRFVDLSAEAEAAATSGVAGALASGMAVNYAGCAATGFVAGTDCIAVSNACDAAEAGSILTDSAVLTPYTVAEVTAAGTTATGDTAVCSITHTNGSTANFTSIDTTP